MTKLDLDTIKARCEAATPGPWYASVGDFSTDFGIIHKDPDQGRRTLAYGLSCDDQIFVAHARTDVPALVAEVERLRAALAKALGETNEPDDFVELFGRFLINEITT